MISSKGWIPDSDRTETVSESDGVEATLPAIVLETECPLLGDQPSTGGDAPFVPRPQEKGDRAS